MFFYDIDIHQKSEKLWKEQSEENRFFLNMLTVRRLIHVSILLWHEHVTSGAKLSQ